MDDRTEAVLGYEFATEMEARNVGAELNRRFNSAELVTLGIYRIRWNGNYLLEAVFAKDIPDQRVKDAQALMGESGVQVHPDDLKDYKLATRRRTEHGDMFRWFRRFMG